MGEPAFSLMLFTQTQLVGMARITDSELLQRLAVARPTLRTAVVEVHEVLINILLSRRTDVAAVEFSLVGQPVMICSVLPRSAFLGLVLGSAHLDHVDRRLLFGDLLKHMILVNDL